MLAIFVAIFISWTYGRAAGMSSDAETTESVESGHAKLIYNSRNLITSALQGKQIKCYKTIAFGPLQLFNDLIRAKKIKKEMKHLSLPLNVNVYITIFKLKQG